jgi:hypothetical protein
VKAAPRVSQKLLVGLFGALCLIGPQWGGSYDGAWIVDGVLALALAAARSLLLAGLVAWAAEPELLEGKRGWLRLLPLALGLLAATQVVASLGTVMPLVAQQYAGEAWLEAIYPHGQLIWVALALTGWALAVMIVWLWTRKRAHPVPARALGKSLLALAIWAVVLWGLKVLADELDVEDGALVALVLDGLTLAGPAFILAAMVGQPRGDGGRWRGVFAFLWAPALWFFSQYGVLLRMPEALADYGVTRSAALLPLDIAGDAIRVAALALYAALAMLPSGERPLPIKKLWRLWPVAVVVLLMELGFGYHLFSLEEAIYAGEYQVVSTLLWVGAAILWQTLTLAAAMLIAALCLKRRPMPWRVLPLSAGMTALELVILLVSYGFALHPAGYSFGMALAVQLPYSRMIGLHALVLAAVGAPRKKPSAAGTTQGG